MRTSITSRAMRLLSYAGTAQTGEDTGSDSARMRKLVCEACSPLASLDAAVRSPRRGSKQLPQTIRRTKCVRNGFVSPQAETRYFQHSLIGLGSRSNQERFSLGQTSLMNPCSTPAVFKPRFCGVCLPSRARNSANRGKSSSRGTLTGGDERPMACSTKSRERKSIHVPRPSVSLSRGFAFVFSQTQSSSSRAIETNAWK